MQASAPAVVPLDEKLDALLGALRRPVAAGALVAFSGGVDSTALLWAAAETKRRWGGRLVALTTTSAASPEQDVADAVDLAERLGVEHVLLPSGETDLAAYRRNAGDRCYHCKTELFRLARAVATERDLATILYGYNASDRGDVRPGHRAALEAGAASPLADANLGKGDVRALLRRAGLAIADKPASPCLASRLQTGVEVTPEGLADVARIEALLRASGVRVLRARVCDAAPGRFLRIEVAPDEMERVLAVRESLAAEGRARGFRWVTLDLEGYRTGGGTA